MTKRISAEKWQHIDADIREAVAMDRRRTLFSIESIAARYGVGKQTVYMRRRILREQEPET